jgi:anti-sigma factor RsiW
MTEEDDIDGLAAEYVLGSLDAGERRQVDARRATDRALADAVAAWERRLGPLADRVPGIDPPSGLFDGILSRISQEAARAGGRTVAALPRASGRRWRMTVGAGALAACLALAIVWVGFLEPGGQQQARMDCSRLYKEFWQKRDPQAYARISAEQLAGLSRMALRAYDACEAGDEQDAKALFERLQRMHH